MMTSGNNQPMTAEKFVYDIGAAYKAYPSEMKKIIIAKLSHCDSSTLIALKDAIISTYTYERAPSLAAIKDIAFGEKIEIYKYNHMASHICGGCLKTYSLQENKCTVCGKFASTLPDNCPKCERSFIYVHTSCRNCRDKSGEQGERCPVCNDKFPPFGFGKCECGHRRFAVKILVKTGEMI